MAFYLKSILLSILIQDATASAQVSAAQAIQGPVTQDPSTNEASIIRRTNIHSPTYYVADRDVDFFINYTGWDPRPTPTGPRGRFFHSQIGEKARQMIAAARDHIILSVFLFDNIYADEEPEIDIAGQLVSLLIGKKESHPEMTIAVILDPSHRAYGDRVAPAERELRDNGIDVFYSDLLGGLKKASFLGVRETAGHINRCMDSLTFHGWGYFWTGLFQRVPAPIGVKIDGERLTMRMTYDFMLAKANHRKILVADDGHGGDEALVTSANPHNASAFHVNTALSVRGTPAKYIYLALREDVSKCARLGRIYAHWQYNSDSAYRKRYVEDRLARIPLEADNVRSPTPDRPAGVGFVTEARIPSSVIRMLDDVAPTDQVRIQMFYLSYQPVLDALLRAARIVDTPIRLLLDANKDSFNKVKDGTPNRQVARYLLEKCQKNDGKIEVRWYSTHGEQNHAKIMSITDPSGRKNILTTGSCNWTGRNMAGVNMEANLIVTGSERLNRTFNEYFDRFWTNADGMEYSLDYEAFSKTASSFKWRIGERPFYYSSF